MKLFGLLFICLGLASAQAQVRILRPNLALPHITTANSSFEAVLEVPAGTTSSKTLPRTRLIQRDGDFAMPVRVDLLKDFDVVPFDLQFAKFAKSNERVSLQVSVGSVPPGLYNLELQWNGETVIAHNAVSIVDTLDRDWKVLHISDTHIGASGALAQYEKTVADANLLNPDFIICTGDIAEEANSDWYRDFVNVTKKLRAPIFVVDGNHDYYNDETLTLYQRYVNPYPNYAASFGEVLVVNLDTGYDLGWTSLWRCYGLTGSQLDWLEGVLAAHGGEIQLLGMHGPFYDALTSNKHGLERMVDLCERFDVDMVLAGHTHKDQVNDLYGNRKTGDFTNFGGTVFLQTTTACKKATIVFKNAGDEDVSSVFAGSDLAALDLDATSEEADQLRAAMAARLPEAMQTGSQKGLVTDHLGYRLIQFRGGQVSTYTEKDGSKRSADNSLETYKRYWWGGSDPNLEVEIERDGSGLVFEITNRHDESFSHCRVGASVSGGTYRIAWGPGQITSAAGASMVEVGFDLAAESTVRIRVESR